MKNAVGPVLRMSEDVEAIIAAIEEDNPGAEIEVIWCECLTAVNLVLRPMLSEILLRQLGIVADENGDQLTWLLLSNLAIDAERNARWSAALARYAISQRPENASVLRHCVQCWTPKADEAAASLATILSELPEIGREADTTMAAAKVARERVLSEAGVLASTV